MFSKDTDLKCVLSRRSDVTRGGSTTLVGSGWLLNLIKRITCIK